VPEVVLYELLSAGLGAADVGRWQGGAVVGVVFARGAADVAGARRTSAVVVVVDGRGSAVVVVTGSGGGRSVVDVTGSVT